MSDRHFALALALLVVGLFILAALTIRNSPPPVPPAARLVLPRSQLAAPQKWGSNVAIFDPTMPMASIMQAITDLYNRSSEFSSQRVALFFMPGVYTLSFKTSYYMGVYGLGRTPDLTVINGTIQNCNNNSDSDPVNCHTKAPDPGVFALDNFWRACENITIVPPGSVNGTNFWAVSQACAMRRVIIDGNIHFSEDNGYSSGGYISDSQITGGVQFGTQQQFISRNVDYGNSGGASGGAWNIVMVGCSGANVLAPAEPLPKSFTVVEPTASLIAPKPYVFVAKDAGGTYQWYLGVPNARQNAAGPPAFNDITVISDFEVITSDSELADAASCGLSMVVAPGIYNAASPILVAPNTVVLGVGMPTLLAGADGAIVALKSVGAAGARVGGFLLEPTSATRTYLLDWGRGAIVPDSHPAPSFLYDIYTRVGGSASPATTPISIPAMVHINLEDTIGDNFWLWVADHGVGIPDSSLCGDCDPPVPACPKCTPPVAGCGNWSSIWKNMHCPSCLIVDADNVAFYGLATEHATGDDLVKWNGDNGEVYFFQSEMPYHPPAGYNQAAFRGSGANLTLQGGGAYSYFPCGGTFIDYGFVLRPDAKAKIFSMFLNGTGGISMTASIGGVPCGRKVNGPPGNPVSGPAWCVH